MALDKGLLEYLLSFLSEQRQELFDKVLANRTRHFSVMVEELYQPHNTNAVLRSCECFGIQDVHVIENNNEFDISTGISMGSHKWLNIHKHQNTVEAINVLKQNGYKVIATSLNEKSISPNELDLSEKSVFMFGTEKTGLSEEAIELADECLKIPMYGFTESFNISVSAAILLSQITNKIRENDEIKWQLSSSEIDEIKMDWVKKHLKAYDKMEEYYYLNIEGNKTNRNDS